MKNLWGRLQLYRLLLDPVKLFIRINQLDWYKNTLRTWVSDLTPDSSVKILELGCASGLLTEYLATCGYGVTGIDASDRMIKAALSNIDRKAQYQTADARSLGFPDTCFDVVIAASLLNVVSEPLVAIKEMARVCRPGGQVSILVPKQGFTDTQMDKLIKTTRVSGLSAAALTTWHKRAPKIRPLTAVEWFKHACLFDIQEREYLDGMLTTVTGRRC